MPTLLIENGKDRIAGTFTGPLLIGRRAANAIVVDDMQVELVHAWISSGPSGYFVANIAKNGRTFVNGQPVTGRQALNHADVIEVGSSLHMTFRDDVSYPAGFRPVELQWRGPMVENVDQPVVFPCACGETISITPVFSGTMSRCPTCGRRVDVPYESAPAPAPMPAGPEPVPAVSPPTELAVEPSVTPAPTAVEEPAPQAATATICGICHTEIAEDEETTSCPDCGLEFHFDCWMANWGCSSYGCSQVNAARPEEKPAPQPAPIEPPPQPQAPQAVTPQMEAAPTREPAPVAAADLAPAAAPVAAPDPVIASAPVEQGPPSVAELLIPQPESQAAQTMPAGPRGTDDSRVVARVPEFPFPPDEFEPFPWEYVALGGSLVALLIGTLTFGIPCAIAGIAIFLHSRHRDARHARALLISVILVVVGFLLGIAVSSIWWLGGVR